MLRAASTSAHGTFADPRLEIRPERAGASPDWRTYQQLVDRPVREFALVERSLAERLEILGGDRVDADLRLRTGAIESVISRSRSRLSTSGFCLSGLQM